MEEGSYTLSDQENPSEPLPWSHPLKDEIEESEVTIATLKGEILGEEQRIRFYVYGILAIIGIAGFIVDWSSFHLNELLVVNPNGFYTYLYFGFIFAGILGLATLIYFVQKIISAQISLTSLKADRDLWSIKKRFTRQFAANFEKPSYLDSLVRINVENLAAFYALVKGHTDKSYKVALRVCAFGFFLMLVGLAIGLTNISSPPIGSYIAIASGVITEIIAGVFFSAYNRNSRQIKGYYDSLLTVQNILLSFKFIENTQDENEKAKIVGQMLAYLMDKQGLYSSDGNEQASHRPATIHHKRI